MDKIYYTLEEAGALLGRQASDVIYLGANEQLPIYVLAADWPVDVHIRYDTEEPNPHSSVPSSEWRPSVEWPLVKTVFRDRLIGPVRLHVATVKKFEANSLATTRYFFMPYASEEPDKIYEYRLSEDDAGKKQPDLALGECTLVVMADDLQILAGKETTSSEVAIADTPPILATKKSASSDELNVKAMNTLLKLIIGMAIKGYSYDPSASKSKTPKEISDDLGTLGLEVGDDTVRKWLKEAVLLLPQSSKTEAK